MEQILDNRKYIRRYRYYNFTATLEGKDETNKMNRTSGLIQSAIDAFTDQYKLLAVFGQFSDYDYKTEGDGNGLILIIKTNFGLFYCYTPAHKLSQAVSVEP